jgi:hypothetical protein
MATFISTSRFDWSKLSADGAFKSICIERHRLSPARFFALSAEKPVGSPESLDCARNSLQHVDLAQSMVAWTIPFERKAR